ncbi:ankyrin repeat domain-containing protein 49 [Thalassophryne amazonica]|uniref:ankyrin repeat domain-containing protein 49 n=1 Tax=Thalassophryne amazonica TaxID=390379 RepID=UPI001470DF00|nr:ankyrin repeat domain-containing protein 49 [Thalassophryne amazonica]
MEFAEDFNQLELLNTHGHLMPCGATSLWTGGSDEEEEQEEHSEDWYLQKEEILKGNPRDLILWAAENNRLSSVCWAVNVDPLIVDWCDEDRYTALHRAAYNGHVGVVAALVAAGANINSRTVDGWTPLHSACRWNQVRVTCFLLQHGTELNAQTNGGLSALHLAASHTSSSKMEAAHLLELLLSQRHLKAGLHSISGETASELARRTGPHHYLFEIVRQYVSVLPIY